MPIKPEELYTNKDKQQDYPQIYNGDELVAIVISFPLEEEEETMEIETEETEPSINATEILAKGSVDLKVLKKKNPKEEDEELNKLREKLKTSDEGGNLREVDPVNPITTANLLYNTSLNKLASSEDLELSRGEIEVSLEDYDPSKDKEKSTKNRWREKPNQHSNFLYKSELLHIENLTKVAADKPIDEDLQHISNEDLDRLVLDGTISQEEADAHKNENQVVEDTNINKDNTSQNTNSEEDSFFAPYTAYKQINSGEIKPGEEGYTEALKETTNKYSATLALILSGKIKVGDEGYDEMIKKILEDDHVLDTYLLIKNDILKIGDAWYDEAMKKIFEKGPFYVSTLLESNKIKPGDAWYDQAVEIAQKQGFNKKNFNKTQFLHITTLEKIAK